MERRGETRLSNNSNYCFRIRFHLPPTVRIHVDALEWILVSPENGPAIVLRASDAETIQDASILLLIGRSFPSADNAEKQGLQWRAVLERAFAEKSIGADFGDRAPRGAWTNAGLQMLEAQTQNRVLNDFHGLMTYECEPRPRFVRAGPITPIVGKNGQDLFDAIHATREEAPTPNPVISLAFDLFSASFFQGSSADARFLMLMMALETLLDPQPRSLKAREHVERLIQLTKESGLPDREVNSLVGSLNWLRNESIQSAGRRLAAKLGDKTYMDQSPTVFFITCYELRGRLVHGSSPRPRRQQVDPIAANLERFVGELLRSWDE